MNASPAMETGAPLVVFGAEVELRSSGGSRSVAVESFWSGPGRTTAAPGEMVTGVRVPGPADGSGSATSGSSTGGRWRSRSWARRRW